MAKKRGTQEESEFVAAGRRLFSILRSTKVYYGQSICTFNIKPIVVHDTRALVSQYSVISVVVVGSW